MAFSGAYVESLEGALQARFPNSWRRLLQPGELGAFAFKPRVRAGWRVEIAIGNVSCPGVDHLLVVVDWQFPLSQPIVLAPQVQYEEYSWPHVETGGKLCLRSSILHAPTGQRLLDHIQWALELLNFPENHHRSEFERESSAYWDHRVTVRGAEVLSLLKPAGPSREVLWYDDAVMGRIGRIFVAETRDTLLTWLRNTGKNVAKRDVMPGWFVWLRHPWIPTEFPDLGGDVLKLVPQEVQARILLPGQRYLVVFGAKTQTGPVLMATLLPSIAEASLKKGFRSLTRVPHARIVGAFSANRVARLPVQRIDGEWVHGRDKNSLFRTIASRKVSVVGCGALGAAVTRLLAQAGVGTFLLVDGDVLAAHNTARHALGQRFLGKNKASAMAQILTEDFPHLEMVTAMPYRFDALSSAQLDQLASSDLIVSAGLDLEGDLQLNRWRRGLDFPLMHICTWTEPFALAGHAVALFGADDLTTALDKQEQVNFRLTDWPEGTGTLIVEAGCANVFQPHGAIALQAIVFTAAALVLDVLTGQVSASCRRVWHGNREEVAKKGGTALETFDRSFCVREHQWS